MKAISVYFDSDAMNAYPSVSYYHTILMEIAHEVQVLGWKGIEKCIKKHNGCISINDLYSENKTWVCEIKSIDIDRNDITLNNVICVLW